VQSDSSRSRQLADRVSSGRICAGPAGVHPPWSSWSWRSMSFTSASRLGQSARAMALMGMSCSAGLVGRTDAPRAAASGALTAPAPLRPADAPDDASNAGLIALVRSLWPGEPLAVSTLYFPKPPGGRGMALHADHRLSPHRAARVWWDALSRSMMRIEKTERCSVVRGSPPDDQPGAGAPFRPTSSSSPRSLLQPPESELVLAEMHAGDVLLFHGGTLHSSMPNRTTDRWRRAFHLSLHQRRGGIRVRGTQPGHFGPPARKFLPPVHALRSSAWPEPPSRPTPSVRRPGRRDAPEADGRRGPTPSARGCAGRGASDDRLQPYPGTHSNYYRPARCGGTIHTPGFRPHKLFEQLGAAPQELEGLVLGERPVHAASGSRRRAPPIAP